MKLSCLCKISLLYRNDFNFRLMGSFVLQPLYFLYFSIGNYLTLTASTSVQCDWNISEPSTVMTDAYGAGLNEHSTKFALIPYSNGGVLSEFYQQKKIFNFTNLGRNLVIKQDWSKNGVAGVVWEAAFVLGKYLSENVTMEKKNVLELGAGTGLLGMAAAACGANVTFTDVEKALPLLRENIELNFPSEVGRKVDLKVKELEWGKHHQRFQNNFYDYIIGADVIYMEEAYDALLETLTFFANSNGHNRAPKTFLSAKRRYDRVEKFVSMLQSRFSFVSMIHEDLVTDVVIYECSNSNLPVT